MLTTSAAVAARLLAAADDGLDVNYVVWIDWAEPVGRRYYSRRPVTIGGVVYEPKLMDAPRIGKLADLSGGGGGALNDGLELRFRNVYEDGDGTPDVTRVGDLADEVPIYGTMVRVGFIEQRTAAGGAASEIKWDHLYRVERMQRSAKELVLRCSDALLLPGEKPIGRPVTDADWPKAPAESYGIYRGPVFGKVEGLPLVPVDIGMEATLAFELDAADTTADLVGGEWSQWPASGWVEIDDEICYYTGINRTLGRLTGMQRKMGFPRTADVFHSAGAVVREIYTGREGVLGANLPAGQAALLVTQKRAFPARGVVMVDNEAIWYFEGTGSWLNAATRGVAVPTLARRHDRGAVVRTIPEAGGQPRYRYLVAQGAATVVGAKSSDEEGREVNKMAAPVVSQVTVAGVVWTVADFKTRPRVDRYSTSVSTVPPEWIYAAPVMEDGKTELTGHYANWSVGDICSPGIAGEIDMCLNPARPTEAVILHANDQQRAVLSVVFNARWDSGLRNPRRIFGRFKDARLRLLVQFSRIAKEWTQPTIYLHRDGLEKRSLVLVRPADNEGVASQVSGRVEATVPADSYTIDQERKTLRFQTIKRGPRQIFNQYYWHAGYQHAPNASISMVTGTEFWDFEGANASENDFAWSFRNPTGGLNMPETHTLVLEAASLGHVGNRGKIVSLRIKAQVMPQTYIQAVYPGYPAGHPTVDVTFFRQENMAAGSDLRTVSVTLNGNSSGQYTGDNIFPTGVTLGEIQSMRVVVSAYRGYNEPYPRLCALRSIWVEVEYQPAITGRYGNGVVAETGFFTDPAAPPENPSDAYEVVMSLGRLATEWARAQVPKKDPWDFFSQGQATAEGGLRVSVFIPWDGVSNGDPVRLAVGNVGLDLEYEAPETYRDGTIVADVDGRTGLPVAGVTPVLLENPVDLLAHLVDSSEFLGMSSVRDNASFELAKSQVSGWSPRMARVITEEISVRELIASLCAESRLLMLFDQGTIYVRYRLVDFSPATAVAHVGDGVADQAARLLGDGDVVREGRIEEYSNQIALSYRENLRTGDPRASFVVDDLPGQRGPIGLRRTTEALKWWQSARGYSAGLAGQKQALAGLAAYLIGMRSRQWEYARLRVYAPIAETLQRNDVITVSRLQSGLYYQAARVVGTSRTSAAGEWEVLVQLAPTSAGVYWSQLTGLGAETGTRIRMAAGGARMDFYWADMRVMSLTAAGDLLCKGPLTLLGVYFAPVSLPGSTLASPVNANIGSATSDFVFGRRVYAAGTWQGRMEYAFKWDNSSQRMGLYPWYNVGAGVAVKRSVVLGAALGGFLGVANGVSDTGSGTTNGVLRFVVGGRSVMEINNTQLRLRGGIRIGAL